MWSWSGCKSEQLNLQVRHPVGKLPHLQRNVLFWGKTKQSQFSIYFCIITLMSHTFCNAATLSGEETFGPPFQVVELFA